MNPHPNPMQSRRYFLKTAAVSVTSLATLPLLSAFRSASDSRAPKSEPWDIWENHSPNSTTEPNYSFLAQLLNTHLSTPQNNPLQLAQFKYSQIKPQQLQDLINFNQQLANTQITDLNLNAQFAFWCNLYNSLTLQVVLQNWPVESIRNINISPGLFARGPWNAEIIEVQNQPLTLNDIEHRILRPIWKDPRIHYAVNCASIGCPNLQLWNSQTLQNDLNNAAISFVNSSRGVSVQNQQITVSKIYSWYIEDFNNDEQGVLQHLKQYAKPELASELNSINKLHNSDYNWDINSV
ncbi:MAG: DUF547 domain-containing protein [Alphaproteobacteria bacterium]